LFAVVATPAEVDHQAARKVLTCGAVGELKNQAVSLISAFSRSALAIF
jgi:hypothetical protein